jgi:O-antigen/teichoic acid export membrane protein
LKLELPKKLKISSEFTKNVLKLFSGTALGNIIAFVALPIITRLFTKEDLGEFQLFLSTITTFSVVSSLKYELAIVLPEDDKEGNDLVILSLLTLILFSFLISIILFLFGNQFLGLLNAVSLKPYIYFISLGIFLMGLVQALQYILVRTKKFGELARNKVIQIVAVQVVSIAFGVFYPSFITLLLAQMIGFIVGSYLIIQKGYVDFSRIGLTRLIQYVKKYKKFPTVNTSMVFLNTFSLQLPVFMLTKFFSTEIVGLYMVANRLMNIPLSLFGKSYSQVYFQSASEAYNKSKNHLLKIYKKTVKQLAFIALAPMILVLVLAPTLVSLFLGSEWKEAGVFMQIITFWIFFQFINMPISSTFTIIDKQEIAFILISISLIVRFIAMYIFSNTPHIMLTALSISAGLFYLAFNISVYFFIKNSKGPVNEEISLK